MFAPKLADITVFARRHIQTCDNPKPFAQTADPDRIIAAVNRGKHVIESAHSLNATANIWKVDASPNNTCSGTERSPARP